MMQLQYPALTKTNKFIMIVSAVFFLLNAVSMEFFQFSLLQIMGLSLVMLKKGIILSLVSYPLVEKDLMSFLFNGLLFWFIGGDLEAKWGTRLYIVYLLICVLSGAFFYLLAGTLLGQEHSVLYGLTGVTYGLIASYGYLFSERLMSFMMIFPIKAKYFAMLLIGIQLYLTLFSAQKFLAISHLGAMFGGGLFLLYKSYRLKNRGFSRAAVNKNQAGLYIVKEQKDKADRSDPKYWQ